MNPLTAAQRTFVDYLLDFYGGGGIYTKPNDPFSTPMTRSEASRAARALSKSTAFEGDTIDREKARELVIGWREEKRGPARRHSTIKAGQSCSVAKYLEVLSHELVRYDVAESAREAKRGIRVNIYRLALLMEALGRLRAALGNRTSDSAADKAAFRMAMYGNFVRDFPPVKKVVKQLDAGTCKIK